MNMKRVCAVCIFLASTTVSHAAGQTKSLTSMKAVYERGIKRIEDEYAEKSAAWSDEYVKALRALKTRMQKAGDLDGWEFVGSEMERFVKSRTIADSDIVRSSPALLAIQTKYGKLPSILDEKKSAAILDLTKLYLGHLKKLRTDLTKRGDVAQALLVKSEAERVRESGPVSAAVFAMAEREARAYRARESSRAPDPTPSAVPTKAMPPADDPEIERMMAIRDAWIKGWKAFRAGPSTKGTRLKLRPFILNWEAVKPELYARLAEVKLGDSLSLRRTKREYLAARESLIAASAEHGNSTVTETRMKKLKKDLAEEEARLEKALGLASPP